MFERAKRQFLKSQFDLNKTKKTKKEVEEMLQERRKQDEKTYLMPVLEKEKEDTKTRDEKKQHLLMVLKEELEKFVKSAEAQEDLDEAKRLLEAIVFAVSIDKKFPETIKESARALFYYFLKIEDIESAVTFLKARSGSLFKEQEYLEKREKYIEYLSQNSAPEVSQESKYILNYGEYREDILRLLELCGKRDKRSAPKGFKGVYYSEESALLVAMGAIGEFGELAYHIYYVPPFGTQDCDRETLEYWHDKGFEEFGKTPEVLDDKKQKGTE